MPSVGPAAGYTPSRAASQQTEASSNQLDQTLYEMGLAQRAADGDISAIRELEALGLGRGPSADEIARGEQEAAEDASDIQLMQEMGLAPMASPGMVQDPRTAPTIDDAPVDLLSADDRARRAAGAYQQDGERASWDVGARPLDFMVGDGGLLQSGRARPEISRPGVAPRNPLEAMGIAPGAVTSMSKLRALEESGAIPEGSEVAFLNYLAGLDSRGAAVGRELQGEAQEQANQVATAKRERRIQSLAQTLASHPDIDDPWAAATALVDSPALATSAMKDLTTAGGSERTLRGVGVTQGGQTRRTQMGIDETKRMEDQAAEGARVGPMLEAMDAALDDLELARESRDPQAIDAAMARYGTTVAEAGISHEEARRVVAAGRATPQGAASGRLATGETREERLARKDFEKNERAKEKISNQSTQFIQSLNLKSVAQIQSALEFKEQQALRVSELGFDRKRERNLMDRWLREQKFDEEQHADAMSNWDRNFIQGQSEFSQQQRLAEDKFADSKARFDRTTQLDEDKFAQSVAVANRADAQFWAEFGQQGQQFAQELALKRKKFKLSEEQEENEVRLGLAKLGIQGKEQEQSVLEWRASHGLDVRKADREDRKVDLSERSIVELSLIHI
jgi:hypothetical protein